MKTSNMILVTSFALTLLFSTFSVVGQYCFECTDYSYCRSTYGPAYVCNINTYCCMYCPNAYYGVACTSDSMCAAALSGHVCDFSTGCCVPGSPTPPTTIPPCNNIGLGTPSVSSPVEDQEFELSCSVDQAYIGAGCIYANADGLSYQCTYTRWSGSRAVFTCPGLPEGTYNARCSAVAGTSDNCCSAATTKSYTVRPSDCVDSCTGDAYCQGQYGAYFPDVYCDLTYHCCRLPPSFSATFRRTGMPTGTQWGVTVDATRYTTTASSLTVSDLRGDVVYYYDEQVGDYYCESGCQGGVSYNDDTKTATYENRPDAYSVTFRRSGIPGDLCCYVTVDGTGHPVCGSDLTLVGLTGTVPYEYQDRSASGDIPAYICSGGCDGTVSGASTITGYYEEEHEELVWDIQVKQGDGTLCVVRQSDNHNYGCAGTSSRSITIPYLTKVRLEATPKDDYYVDYSFDRFSGENLDDMGAAGHSGDTYYSTWFNAEGEGGVWAYFNPPTEKLTIVIADGEGNACLSWGGNSYCTRDSRTITIPRNTVVRLTACPDDGYDFMMFSGGGASSGTAGDGGCQFVDITASATGTINVYFTPESYEPGEDEVTYSLEIGGTGGGYATITYTPPSGGTTTRSAYENDPVVVTAKKSTTVTLNAYPNTNYKFDKWSGLAGGESESNPKTFTAVDSRMIIAYFTPAEVDFWIEINQGKGQVCLCWPYDSASGICTPNPTTRCTFDDMTVTIPWGVKVRMTAYPRSDEYFDWEFYRFGGTKNYYDNPAIFSSDYSGTIYVQFNPVTVDWTIRPTPDGAGQVCAGGYCTSTERTVSLLRGVETTLEAMPNSGYIFSDFSGLGGSIDDNPLYPTPTATGNIYANFVEGCSSDEDCADVDCSLQDHTGRIAECIDNICECDPCTGRFDCEEGWCCDADVPGGYGFCRREGYIHNNKYLCDPPLGFVETEPNQEEIIDYNQLIASILEYFAV